MVVTVHKSVCDRALIPIQYHGRLNFIAFVAQDHVLTAKKLVDVTVDLVATTTVGSADDGSVNNSASVDSTGASVVDSGYFSHALCLNLSLSL